MRESIDYRVPNGRNSIPFVMGAVVGACCALMLAPATGAETRRRLGDTARRLRHKGKEQVDRLTHRGRAAVDNAQRDLQGEATLQGPR